MTSKPGTPNSQPTKTLIFSWIRQILPDTSSKLKVEDLGNGVIYCRIVNHYFPGSINPHRINSNPKNEYEYTLNLKLFQNALTQHKVTAPFDMGKVSKLKFLQNWALINCLYKHLVLNNEDLPLNNEDSRSVISQSYPKFTPKRSFESSFPQLDFIGSRYRQQCPSHRQENIRYQDQNIRKRESGIPSMGKEQDHDSFKNHQANRITLKAQKAQQNLRNQLLTSDFLDPCSQNVAVTPFNPTFTVQNMFAQQKNPSNIFSSELKYSLNDINTSQNLKLFAQHQMQRKVQIPEGKCWSVGKLPRQTLKTSNPFSKQSETGNNLPGKYSVNSHIFQHNYNAVIDRIKEILIKRSHDIEKIRQIKMLLNIPLNEDVVKIEEEELTIQPSSLSRQSSSQRKKQTEKNKQNLAIRGQYLPEKQRVEGPKDKRQPLSVASAINSRNTSENFSNDCNSKRGDKQGNKPQPEVKDHPYSEKSNQRKSQSDRSASLKLLNSASEKKIKNNFEGEGSFFRR